MPAWFFLAAPGFRETFCAWCMCLAGQMWPRGSERLLSGFMAKFHVESPQGRRLPKTSYFAVQKLGSPFSSGGVESHVIPKKS